MKKEPSYIDSYADLAVSLLKRLIPIPAYSKEEARRAAFLQQWICARREAPDFQVERYSNNLILTPLEKDDGRPTLMLCAHMDTVHPASDYSFNPHQAFEGNGTVYGLGSNDDGASLVSMLAAFLYFHSDPALPAGLPVNLMLVIEAEEEISGPDGMAAVLEHLKEEGRWYPDFAVIGEPTALKAAVGERGLLVLDGTATGVSGHAARNEGVNALYIALEDIDVIRNFPFDRESPLMGKMRATVTALHCGKQHNVIPDKAEFVVDIRPNEQYSNQEILDLLQGAVRSRLVPRNMTHRTSFTPKDHLLYRTIEKLGLETYVSPTTSDWVLLDIPGVKLGPGESARSHKKDEFIKIREITEGIALYINFIENI